MAKKNEGIYISAGAVDMSKLSPDKEPENFWEGIVVYSQNGRRDDLELRFYKNQKEVLSRLAPSSPALLLLQTPETDVTKTMKHAPFISCDLQFLLHPHGDAAYQKIKRWLTRYMHDRIHGSGPELAFKTRLVEEDTDLQDILEGNEYLALKENVFNCFGNHEGWLKKYLLKRFRPEEGKYLLEEVDINIYIQAEKAGGISVPDKMKALDIRDYSIYQEIGDSLAAAAKKNGFGGFNCEYLITGVDRNSLYLFFEADEDRWDGKRYQINYRISLYQLPGKSKDESADQIIRFTDEPRKYRLDSIIVGGDRCGSLREFNAWAKSHFFGYWVD